MRSRATREETAESLAAGATGAADGFRRFAEAAEDVASTHSTRRKVRAVADYLAPLSGDGLRVGATFFSGAPFPATDPRTLQVGWAVVRDAALRLLPYDAETFGVSARIVGDVGETLGKLFRTRNALEGTEPEGTRPAAQAQRSLLDFHADEPAPDVADLSLLEVRDRFAALAAARGPDAKRRILEETLRRLGGSPMEVQFFVKILLRDMRIGLQEALVEEGIARAFGRQVEAVRMAHMLTGDAGETAVLAREDRLHEARFRFGHPLKFMLAAAAELDALPEDLADYLAEDKYDGIRCQLHKEGSRVWLFTRNQGDATELFPEVVEAARRVPGGFVLDGEVVAVTSTGRVAPFARLQRRLGRKGVPHLLRREVPVRFVAYDLLHRDGRETFREAFEDRLAALEEMPLDPHLLRSPVAPAASPDAVRARFEAAVARGNEGLVLKRRESPYEFGKRGKGWLKIKRPFATLDVVVTAAEMGHGKRAGLLSDYTFAVRGPNGRYLNVGKAYSGVTDEEIAQLTRRLKALAYERHGRVFLVRPEIVLEVAFDGVQESPRHASGYALRFPRIVRIRDDKAPEEADTLEAVAGLHARALAHGEPA